MNSGQAIFSLIAELSACSITLITRYGKKTSKANKFETKKSAKVFDVKAQFPASDRKIFKDLVLLDTFAYLKIWKNWPKTM